MSNNTVETTTTPAEVSSSTTQSIAQVSRLKPISERNKKVTPKSNVQGIGHQYVREVKNDYNKMVNELFCTSTPLLLNQLESLGLTLEVDMEDQVLCRIANLAKTVEFRVDVVQRLKAVDYLGVYDKNKRTICEFFTYQQLISGYDKRGQPVGSAYVTVNEDYQVPIRQQFSEDDEPLTPIVSGTKFPVYTTLWTPEELDKVLQNQDPSHKVQFTVTNGSASYGGYSLDEFRNCSFAEAEMRGKTGYVNQPVEDTISTMTKQERLGMIKNVIPK